MLRFGVAILTAPPVGLAAEAGGPFVKIDGREALLRSVELFLNRESVSQIQLVIQPDALEEAKRKYGAHLSFSGVKVLSGGPRWIDQLAVAAGSLAADVSHVIIHDAARPAISYSDIDGLMVAAESAPIVALATVCRCPLVELDDGGQPMAIHTPTRYMQLVTPQVYSREKLREVAQRKAEPHGSEIRLLKGSSLNVRVGGAGDAGLVKTMLSMLPKPKSKGPLTPFDEAQW